MGQITLTVIFLFTLASFAYGSFLNDFYERNKREILARGYTKFKLPISYYIANETLKANVTKALERFRNQTCLNFTEVNNSSEIKKGNGLIFLCANGCSTLSGKDPNNTRYINLADGCLTPYGIQSMVGITLGINYEHLRRDRDDYIKLRWSNIPEKFKYIFNNSMFYNVSKSFGVHYNFGSGFQIGPWWYGENARDAFKVKEKIYYDTLGQQSLDFSDYKLVNLYYCKNTCSKSTVKPPTCQNSGYQDPKDCKKCRCPLFYEGTNCEKLRNSSENCSTPKEIKLSDNNTFFRLGDEGNKTCFTRIEAPENKTVEIFLATVTYSVKNERIYLRCRPKQSLQVKYYKDKGPMGALFCGDLFSRHFYSHGNIVDLRFSGINPNDSYTMLVRTSNKTYISPKQKRKKNKSKNKTKKSKA